MADEIETGMTAFLLADAAILELVQTAPESPRFYPSVAPQGMQPDNLHVLYWLVDRFEHGQMGGVAGLVKATLMLECRQRAASPKQARLLAKRIRESRGPDPTGARFHGYRGSWPLGYVVQKCMVTNTRYRIEKPVKAEERAIHAVALEVEVFWNA